MLWKAENGQVSWDGERMHYAAFGRGPRPLIVLPGLSDGLATVKGKALLLAGPYVPYLDRFRVYMFSRRDGLPAGTTIRDMAADQARAMARLGIDRACVMGVSQGGMIAQYLAADHPERVDRLVLAVTAPRLNPITQACLSEWTRLARAGRHRALMIDTAHRSYSPARLRRYRMLLPLLGLIGKPRSYDRFLANADAIMGFDATGALGRIHAPTLIIGGAEDKVVGAQASRELHAAIPGSRLHIYPGLGHAAYEEAPDFCRRVFAFLEEG